MLQDPKPKTIMDYFKDHPIGRDAADSTAHAMPYVIPNERKDYFDRMNQIEAHTSNTANVERAAIPLPQNAAGVVMKKVFKRNDMDNNSLTDAQKGVMYKVIDNAVKRTGKMTGGTEYEDYKGVVSPREYQQIQNAKNGHINPVLGTVMGTLSDGYNMATTLGRVSYAKDPLSGNIALTDGYNFTNNYTQGKDGKLKAGYMQGKSDPYSMIRRNLAEEDQDQDAATRDRYFVGMQLTPQDTLYTRFRANKR